MLYTLVEAHQYQETIRKSRFIAIAAPIQGADDVQAFFEHYRQPGASHHCWAWKCGQQYRFSDDGEPGGTAGRPILAAIEAQMCDRVAVMVIRWYGGIQLGTGGLARAYGGSAQKCLQEARREALVERQVFNVHLPFSLLQLFKSRLGEFSAQLEAERFDAEGAWLQVAIPPAQGPAMAQLVDNLSKGACQLRPA